MTPIQQFKDFLSKFKCHHCKNHGPTKFGVNIYEDTCPCGLVVLYAPSAAPEGYVRFYYKDNGLCIKVDFTDIRKGKNGYIHTEISLNDCLYSKTTHIPEILLKSQSEIIETIEIYQTFS